MLKLESSRYVVVLSVRKYTRKGGTTRPGLTCPPGSAQMQLEFGFGGDGGQEQACGSADHRCAETDRSRARPSCGQPSESQGNRSS